MVLLSNYSCRFYSNPMNQIFDDPFDYFAPWHYSNKSPTALVVIPNNLKRLDKQHQLSHQEKFHVQLNVAEFNPETIQLKVNDGKIIVEARHEVCQPDGDYQIRQLRKSYPLPEYADAKHLMSHVTPNKVLVIEVPIRRPEVEQIMPEAKTQSQRLAKSDQNRNTHFDCHSFSHESDFQQNIVNKGDNQKQLKLSIEMKNYKPDEIKVSVKNNKLIVRGEHQSQNSNKYERCFYFKSTTLPSGTQIEQLKSYLTDDGHLKIEAPYIEQEKILQSVKQSKDTKQDQDSAVMIATVQKETIRSTNENELTKTD